MSKAARVPDYLAHILKAIGRIERYTADMSEAMFLSSEMAQDAVLRNIEIIGEASNNIRRVDSAFTARHSDVPWQVMYRMRNRVSHGYNEVNLEIVWQTIQDDLPLPRAQITALSATLSRNREETQG